MIPLAMQDLAGKSLGMLLTRGPGHPDVGRALGLAHAAAERGAKVEIFLMAEGAGLLGSPDALAFDRPGVRVTACTLSAMSSGAPTDLPFVDYAGQFQLAAIVARTDRFVAFS